VLEKAVRGLTDHFCRKPQRHQWLRNNTSLKTPENPDTDCHMEFTGVEQAVAEAASQEHRARARQRLRPVEKELAKRVEVAEMIDKGQTDRQIFEELLKGRGPQLLRPHMSP
jgi:hypothetical protein